MIQYKRTHASVRNEIRCVNKTMNKHLVPGAGVAQQAKGCRGPKPSAAGQASICVCTLCPSTAREATAGGTSTYTHKSWPPSCVSAMAASALGPRAKGTHGDTCAPTASNAVHSTCGAKGPPRLPRRPVGLQPGPKAHRRRQELLALGWCDVALERPYLRGLVLWVTLAGLRDAWQLAKPYPGRV